MSDMTRGLGKPKRREPLYPHVPKSRRATNPMGNLPRERDIFGMMERVNTLRSEVIRQYNRMTEEEHEKYADVGSSLMDISHHLLEASSLLGTLYRHPDIV